MTWNELKGFCNSLPEFELQKNVIMWREDEAITAIEAQTLEEDHYMEPDAPENGCFPESDAIHIVTDSTDHPNGMADLKKAYDKGHPILCEKF